MNNVGKSYKIKSTSIMKVGIIFSLIGLFLSAYGLYYENEAMIKLDQSNSMDEELKYQIELDDAKENQKEYNFVGSLVNLVGVGLILIGTLQEVDNDNADTDIKLGYLILFGCLLMIQGLIL